MIGLVRRPRRRLFWLHNPGALSEEAAQSVAARAGIARLWSLTGAYHAGTVPRWLPRGGREIIPYGCSTASARRAPREPPPPRAVFTSNPLRGLDWLLDLWTARIAPAVPGPSCTSMAGRRSTAAARQGGAADGGGAGPRRARSPTSGVRRFAPVGRDELAAVLAGARVMLYRGDPGETFCLALAEAQAMGVPAVVHAARLGRRAGGRRSDGPCRRGRGRLSPRRRSRVLRDDELWRRWHRAALAHQRGLSWDEVAARFEALMA